MEPGVGAEQGHQAERSLQHRSQPQNRQWGTDERQASCEEDRTVLAVVGCSAPGSKRQAEGAQHEVVGEHSQQVAVGVLDDEPGCVLRPGRVQGRDEPQ